MQLPNEVIYQDLVAGQIIAVVHKGNDDSNVISPAVLLSTKDVMYTNLLVAIMKLPGDKLPKLYIVNASTKPYSLIDFVDKGYWGKYKAKGAIDYHNVLVTDSTFDDNGHYDELLARAERINDAKIVLSLNLEDEWLCIRSTFDTETPDYKEIVKLAVKHKLPIKTVSEIYEAGKASNAL